MDYLGTAMATSVEEFMLQWNKSYAHVYSSFVYSVLVLNFSCNAYEAIKQPGTAPEIAFRPVLMQTQLGGNINGRF
jgi:hypothetical protein